MTRFGLGPVHSPAGPGPIIRVQVHPYLDLDMDIWGPDSLFLTAILSVTHSCQLMIPTRNMHQTKTKVMSHRTKKLQMRRWMKTRDIREHY